MRRSHTAFIIHNFFSKGIVSSNVAETNVLNAMACLIISGCG